MTILWLFYDYKYLLYYDYSIKETSNSNNIFLVYVVPPTIATNGVSYVAV